MIKRLIFKENECKEEISENKCPTKFILIAPENKIMGYSLSNLARKLYHNLVICITTPIPKDVWEMMIVRKYNLWIMSSSLLNKTSSFFLVEKFINGYGKENLPPIIFVGGNSDIYKEYLKFKEKYQLDNTEYLLKPVNPKKFEIIFNKLIK